MKNFDVHIFMKGSDNYVMPKLQVKKSKDKLSLDYFSSQFLHHIVIWACSKI